MIQISTSFSVDLVQHLNLAVDDTFDGTGSTESVAIEVDRLTRGMITVVAVFIGDDGGVVAGKGGGGGGRVW
ncbi:hypothetical protein L2E82_29206 [Cichorium intybus]|uniref:Uncharacterized protein n=1 Tax=Cichorium intybus TaxID=13427 RepID=A0ACB9CX72_CICIN|nr:hypothetical protein L2E82_29206 [Cichorium intybus]